MKRSADDDGYTLMELLIVLALLALIATFAIPNLLGVFGNAKSDMAEIQLRNLKSVLSIYRLDNGHYPAITDGGLAALHTRPAKALSWQGPYLDNPEALTDPWGRPYIYSPSPNGLAFQLKSLGADGAEGGEGENRDIVQ